MAALFAYYLPQFYPTPENDKYWGKGFTEWTNVKNAIPLYEGHNQPKVPTLLGYYSLEDIEVLRKQTRLARQHGIRGFSFWHYWFSEDQQTLEKVPEMLRGDPSIQIDYFFTWANGPWTSAWIGKDEQIIFEQTYSRKSFLAQAKYLVEFFSDSRYLKVGGRPVFQILRPDEFDLPMFRECLEEMAIEHGFKGVWIITPDHPALNEQSRKSINEYSGFPPGDAWGRSLATKVYRRTMSKFGLSEMQKGPEIISLERFSEAQVKNAGHCAENGDGYIPCILPNWDNTPRYGAKGQVFEGDAVLAFEFQLKSMKKLYEKYPNKTGIILLKAWNEWAEGNYLEPDEALGLSLLKKVKEVFQ